MADGAASPWDVGEGAGRHLDSVSLVDGTTFAVSATSGAIGAAAVHGLYLFDTRALSRWCLDVRGWHVEPLSYVPGGPFGGTFVARADHGRGPDAPVTLIQRRFVGRGMREDIEVRNHGGPQRLTLELSMATDLAGLFEVKAGHRTTERVIETTGDASGLRMRASDGVACVLEAVTVVSSEPPDDVDDEAGKFVWHLTLAAGGSWSTCVQVSVAAGGREIAPSHRCGDPVEEAIPVGRLQRWRAATPDVRSGDPVLDRMVVRAVDDLGALRIFDPDHAERTVVAAGAPWFMALFGRDSLLASWMAMPFDQDLARGVLAELADNQGTAIDARTEEQPGRILHEVRFDRLSAQLLGGANTYYGTIDATPLFVMLVAELARWTGATEQVRSLLPAVDRAIEWVERYGDRDGDGFVEYQRSNPAGLEHQGWKDSWDGIRHADGSVAAPPIALCEVQGYVYAAYRGRAELGRALGEDATGRSFDRRADDLRARFDDAFWLDDRGFYAVGLDGDKRPIRSLTSNLGHLLWTGIVPAHRAARLAEVLVSPGLHTGWGLRTLGREESGYNPLSYHCGSVWPHDTALAIAGLSRYGLDAESQRLSRSLIDVAASSDGRLPELFGGFDRADIAAPVPYPSSCAPQAWSSAAPLLLVRAMLGLDADLPNGTIRLRPRIPAGVDHLHLHGMRLGGEVVDITSGRDGTVATGTTLAVQVT